MLLLVAAQINDEELKKYIHQEASDFRRKKIKEFLDKPKTERTEMEESIIKSWAEHYGNNLY